MNLEIVKDEYNNTEELTKCGFKTKLGVINRTFPNRFCDRSDFA